MSDGNFQDPIKELKELDKYIELKKVAAELVAKLDVIHKDESYKSVWVMYQAHGQQYDGPTYKEELIKLRSLL